MIVEVKKYSLDLSPTQDAILSGNSRFSSGFAILGGVDPTNTSTGTTEDSRYSGPFLKKKHS